MGWTVGPPRRERTGQVVRQWLGATPHGGRRPRVSTRPRRIWVASASAEVTVVLAIVVGAIRAEDTYASEEPRPRTGTGGNSWKLRLLHVSHAKPSVLKCHLAISCLLCNRTDMLYVINELALCLPCDSVCSCLTWPRPGMQRDEAAGSHCSGEVMERAARSRGVKQQRERDEQICVWAQAIGQEAGARLDPCHEICL